MSKGDACSAPPTPVGAGSVPCLPVKSPSHRRPLRPEPDGTSARCSSPLPWGHGSGGPCQRGTLLGGGASREEGPKLQPCHPGAALLLCRQLIQGCGTIVGQPEVIYLFKEEKSQESSPEPG